MRITELGLALLGKNPLSSFYNIELMKRRSAATSLVYDIIIITFELVNFFVRFGTIMKTDKTI